MLATLAQFPLVERKGKIVMALSMHLEKLYKCFLTSPVQQELPQSFLKHLRWLLQKDKLGQDVFLIGPPGPLRRQLALSYLEMTKRELEFVTLTRDTTDTDLKQRREIRGGTSFYHDQVRGGVRPQGT